MICRRRFELIVSRIIVDFAFATLKIIVDFNEKLNDDEKFDKKKFK